MSESTEIERILSRFEQRINNLIRNGRIAEIQGSPPRVKVEYDKDEKGNPVLTGWIRYFEERQGYVQTWNSVKLGEQCLIFSPSGNLSLGVALLGLNTTDNPPISSDSNIHKIKFSDGSTFEFNRSSSQWTISLGSGNTVFNGTLFTFNSDIVVNGDILQTGEFEQIGNFTSNSNIVGNMVSDSMGSMVSIRSTYNGHRHNTGDPVPDKQMN